MTNVDDNQSQIKELRTTVEAIEEKRDSIDKRFEELQHEFDSVKLDRDRNYSIYNERIQSLQQDYDMLIEQQRLQGLEQ